MDKVLSHIHDIDVLKEVYAKFRQRKIELLEDVPPKFKKVVLEIDKNGNLRVNRMNYEISVSGRQATIIDIIF
ncbi:MAG: hypothetical protein WB502_07225 [Thermoactinomyces sp.]